MASPAEEPDRLQTAKLVLSGLAAAVLLQASYAPSAEAGVILEKGTTRKVGQAAAGLRPTPTRHQLHGHLTLAARPASTCWADTMLPVAQQGVAAVSVPSAWDHYSMLQTPSAPHCSCRERPH